MTSEPSQGRLEKLGGEILRAAAVELAGRVLLAIAGVLVAALGLLIWSGASVPAWVLLVVVVALVGLAVLLMRQRGQGFVGVMEDKRTLEQELGRHKEYSEHLQNSLDALQRVLSQDVDAEIPYYLEQAVLEPAQRILIEKPAEKVRLSVLLPADEDPARWSMRWSAGHTMIGKLKYDKLIADTLARHAFETGEPQEWGDTESQTDFQQNPEASFPTRSLVSLPIRKGDDVLGVFNAVSAEKDAFDDAEKKFLASLAGIIAVAVSAWRGGPEPVRPEDELAFRQTKESK